MPTTDRLWIHGFEMNCMLRISWIELRIITNVEGTKGRSRSPTRSINQVQRVTGDSLQDSLLQPEDRENGER